MSGPTEVLGRVADTETLLLFWCPGCKCAHHLDTTRWVWNGDMAAPTANPSLLIHPDGHRPRCHLFMRKGRLEFLHDSTHALAGQTVPMGAWDDEKEPEG